MMKILLPCAALAVGEALAASCPTLAPLWPLFAVLALFGAAFGYGHAWPHWPCVFLLLLGVALFGHAEHAKASHFRSSPWFRERARRAALETPVRAAIRRDFLRRVSIGLSHDPDVVALNRAILLGDRDRLSPRLKRVFRASGTVHVFAISGMHVMVVAQTLVVLLSFCFVPYRLQGVVALPLLAFYVWLVGGSPSAVRAGIMAGFYLLAPFFWRRPDGLVSWALTFMILHVLDPAIIMNVGSQLSFAVMLAILLALRLFREMRDGFGKMVAVTVASWAVAVPISAHVFGTVTPGGLLANLVLIAAAGYSVMAGIVGVVLSFVSETLAAHANNFSALATRSMVLISETVSSLPFSSITVIPWSFALCAEWYVMLSLTGWLFWRHYHQGIRSDFLSVSHANHDNQGASV